MRPGADYIALRDLRVSPDSYAFAARAGDDVTEIQRVNLGLTVGVDITPVRVTAMAEPDKDADRRDWQNYAVVRGVPYIEAVNLDRGDLVKRIEAANKQAAEPVSAGEMPAEADKKERWSDFAALEILRRTNGAVTLDEARDRVKPLTKAELVETFGPNAAPDAGAELIAVPEPDGPVGGPVADPVAEQGNPPAPGE